MSADELDRLRAMWIPVCPSWCRVDHVDEEEDPELPREADDGWDHVWWQSQEIADGGRVTVGRYQRGDDTWEPPRVAIGRARSGELPEHVNAEQAKALSSALHTAAWQLSWLEVEIGKAGDVAADIIGEFGGYLRTAGKSEHTIHNRIVRLRLLGEVVDLVNSDTGDLAAALGAVDGVLGASDYTLLRSWFGWLAVTGRRADDPTSQLKPLGRRRNVEVATSAVGRRRWFSWR